MADVRSAGDDRGGVASPSGPPPSEHWGDPTMLAAVAAEHAPDMLVVADPTGAIRFVGRSAERILGIDPRRHRASHLLHFVHPDDGQAVLAAIGQATEEPGYHRPVKVRVRRGDDGWADCEANAQSVEGPGGVWTILSIRGLGDRDVISERRSALERLIRTTSLECSRVRWFEADDVVEHLLRSLAGLLGAREVELAWVEDDDPDGTLRLGAHWSTRVEDDWGIHSQELPGIGSLFESMAGGDGQPTTVAEVADLHAGAPSAATKRYLERGLQGVVELPLVPGRRGSMLRLGFEGDPERWDAHNVDLVHLIGTTLVSTLRRCQAEERLHERARRDPLTGLLNRDELYRALSAWTSSPRGSGRVGVLYADVDRFKEVNDRFGHAVGDDLLRGVARVMESSVREGDVVARMGGDEFVAVCRLEEPSQLGAIARRIGERVVDLRVEDLPVGVSVGAAVWADELSADDLVGAADAEMYRAKRARALADG